MPADVTRGVREVRVAGVAEPRARDKFRVRTTHVRPNKSRLFSGVARELCPNPDVTRNFFAERCDCGGKVPLKGQVLAHAYDHIEIRPIGPWTTRNNLYKGDCACCGKTVTAEPPADMPPGSPFGPGIVRLSPICTAARWSATCDWPRCWVACFSV